MIAAVTEGESAESLAVREFEKLAKRYEGVRMTPKYSAEVLAALQVLAPRGLYIGPDGLVELRDYSFAPDQEGVNSFWMALVKDSKEQEESVMSFLELYRRFEPLLI